MTAAADLTNRCGHCGCYCGRCVCDDYREHWAYDLPEGACDPHCCECDLAQAIDEYADPCPDCAAEREKRPSQPAQRPNVATEGYEYNHIAGRWQTVKWRVFRAFGVVPRALCGTILDVDPNRPQPTPASPFCPTCLARNGTTEGLIWVEPTP